VQQQYRAEQTIGVAAAPAKDRILMNHARDGVGSPKGPK
jgi:hypothetical protein